MRRLVAANQRGHTRPLAAVVLNGLVTRVGGVVVFELPVPVFVLLELPTGYLQIDKFKVAEI